MKLAWKKRPSDLQAAAWLKTVVEPLLDMTSSESVKQRVGEAWPNAEQIARYLPEFTVVIHAQQRKRLSMRQRELLRELKWYLYGKATCSRCGRLL